MRFKLAVSLFLALLVFLFVAQNTDPVTVQLFFWPLDMSLALLIFIMLAAGIVIGWLFNSYLRFARQRASQQKPKPASNPAPDRKETSTVQESKQDE